MIPLRRRFLGWLRIIVFITAAILFVVIPYLLFKSHLKRPPVDAQLTTLTLPAGTALASLQRATIDTVVDGDTIDVNIGGKVDRVRYYGVETPARGTHCYRVATDRNQQLAGKTVLLLPDARERDQFGSLLRYVFLDDGTSVNATLVAEGLGNASTQDGVYREQIEALQQQAQAAGRGCLWAKS